VLIVAPHMHPQVIVESDFSLPTFASCLFRLRGDSKAIVGERLVTDVSPTAHT
jgi:hypothetical protein